MIDVSKRSRSAAKAADIDALIAEIRRIDHIAGGYAIVEIDLRAHGIPLGMVADHANRVAREFEQAKKALAAAQAQCSHAFERIGEARPPFERCVRCYLTRAAP